MAITNSERYGNLIDAKLENVLALKDGVVFNNKYEGDPKAGAVKIPVTNEATLADYDKANGITATAPSVTYVTVSINKDRAVNEILDNYDVATVPAPVIADRLTSASKALANTMDADGATELVASGTVMDDTTALTKDNVYDCFVDARTAMSESGVPAVGRYALVSPSTFSKVLKSDEFIGASNLSDTVKQTGAIGAIAGFNVYESNNLGENVEAVFGHPDYATRVKEWAVEPSVVALADGKHIGACAVQGRNIYAHKVTNANAILVKKVAE